MLSPDDRWHKVLGKVAEYLDAGVRVVVVLDPERRMIHVFTDDEPTRILTDRDELTIPGLLGNFRFPGASIFRLTRAVSVTMRADESRLTDPPD